MARFDGGWVKVHRSINTSEIGRDGIAYCLFLRLLTWANIQDSRLDGKPIKRGEVVTSADELAEVTGFHRATIYRKLELMEKLNMLRRSTRHRGTTISIVNYDKYQDVAASHETEKRNDERQVSDNPATTLRHERDSIEELENSRIKELEKPNTRARENFLQVVPPKTQINYRQEAIKILTRIEAAVRKAGTQEHEAAKIMGTAASIILGAKYPDWLSFCSEYSSAHKDGRGTIFAAQLRDMIEAMLPDLRGGQTG